MERGLKGCRLQGLRLFNCDLEHRGDAVVRVLETPFDGALGSSLKV